MSEWQLKIFYEIKLLGLNIWNYMNGNKTHVGQLMLILYFSDALYDYTLLNEVSLYLGSVLTGVGYAHKGIKSNTKPGPNT